MSNVIATMANALIEFILSLLRDPEAAAEFEADPEGALSARGLQNVDYNDMCAVLPMVYDNPHVILRGDPEPFLTTPPPPPQGPSDNGPGSVIQQLQDIITNNAYVTNNSTLLDQSVNQNLWAEGDILQLFDNEAIIASGEGSSAAGRDIVDDDSTDSSTTITVGRDAVVDSTVDTDTTVGSNNDTVVAPVTDSSVDTTVTNGTATTNVDTGSAATTDSAASTEPASTTEPAPAEPAAESDAAAEPAAESDAAPEPAYEASATTTADESDPYAPADESTALAEPEPLTDSAAESEY